jgi:16S rRNA (uracil1498-N3)-methyltransferase
MSEPMFYCESLPNAGELVQLPEDEARHASASRRLKQGDVLWLFDGHGNLARATLAGERGRSLQATLVERRHVPAPRPAIHLACALPKGDRAAVMLDMATQLGVSSFTPLLCERSVVDPGEGTLERLRRVCLEACKQSRRAYLPTIHTPIKFRDAVAREGVKWIAHPDGAAVNNLTSAQDQPLTLLIGPEGGFTEDELSDAARNGALRVALGEGILRIEAAAVALCAAVMLGQTGR